MWVLASRPRTRNSAPRFSPAMRRCELLGRGSCCDRLARSASKAAVNRSRSTKFLASIPQGLSSYPLQRQGELATMLPGTKTRWRARVVARLCAFLCVLTIIFGSTGGAQAATEPRVALVIGNSDYGPEIGKLKNPINDA